MCPICGSYKGLDACEGSEKHNIPMTAHVWN